MKNKKTLSIFIIFFCFLSIKLVFGEEIIFEAPEIELLRDNEGFSKFDTNDMIGTTTEEGFPELPIYSSLFQMSPVQPMKLNMRF